MGSRSDTRRAVLAKALRPSRRMRICDVGANPLSEPPYQGLLADRLCEVYGFEPNPEALKELQDAGSDLETYYPDAVGDPGERTLHLHPRSGFTSLYPMDRASLAQIGKTFWIRADRMREMPLRTVALDEIDGFPQIDALKMDLQGAEIEVLRGGRRVLGAALAIVTEVRFHRIYRGEAMFGDLDVALRAAGFRLHKFLFTKSVMMPHGHEDKVVRKRMTSQLLDGDAVYLRDGDIAGWDDDALIHLAFLADTVFDSPDLVLGCIDLLAGRGKADAGLADRYIARLRTHQRAAPRQAAG